MQCSAYRAVQSFLSALVTFSVPSACITSSIPDLIRYHSLLHLQAIPLYCFDPKQWGTSPWGDPRTGPFRAQFLLGSLHTLRDSLRAIGSDLLTCACSPAQAVKGAWADGLSVWHMVHVHSALVLRDSLSAISSDMLTCACSPAWAVEGASYYDGWTACVLGICYTLTVRMSLVSSLAGFTAAAQSVDGRDFAQCSPSPFNIPESPSVDPGISEICGCMNQTGV